MKTVEAAMRSVRAGSVALLYALIGLCATTGSAATVMATTEPFRLSIKHDGIRPSTGDEELAYSSLWDGGDGATVAIAQDGAAIAEGRRDGHVRRDGPGRTLRRGGRVGGGLHGRV